MTHPRLPHAARTALLWALCLQCAPSFGAGLSVARAQDDGTAGSSSASGGAIAVAPISIDGEDINTLGIVRIGIEACTSDAPIVFELDNVPNKESIDVYTGSDCNSTSREDSTSNACDHVATVTAETRQDLRITVNASALIENCEAGTMSKPTLWFLAIDNPRSSEDVGTGYGTFAITLDTRAPDAPEDVEGGSGENEIPVDWSTSETDLEGFRVFIDPGDGGVTGDAGVLQCGSGLLQEGLSANSVPSSVRTKNVGEATATGTRLRGGDIDAMRAAVAVVAIDEAGNESVLSEVVCVDVVPTTGFWEQYQAEGGKAEGGCPCTAIGPVHAHTAWPVLLAIALVALRGRRRS